ncbi:hypothetical protein K5M56_02305, partial [Serratia marcescens]|nr:hypothetical protein [Serratia marcescens]
ISAGCAAATAPGAQGVLVVVPTRSSTPFNTDYRYFATLPRGFSGLYQQIVHFTAMFINTP